MEGVGPEDRRCTRLQGERPALSLQSARRWHGMLWASEVLQVGARRAVSRLESLALLLSDAGVTRRAQAVEARKRSPFIEPRPAAAGARGAERRRCCRDLPA